MPRWLHSVLFQSIVVATLVIVATLFVTRPKYDQANYNEQNYSNPYFDEKLNDKVIGLSPEWWTAIFTGVLAIFTIILSISTIGLWISGENQIKTTRRLAIWQSRQTRASLKISERALIATHRPWITVSIDIKGPLSYDPRGAYFPFRFNLENVGKSPAKNVFVRPEIVCPESVDGNPITPQDVQRRIIRDVKKYNCYPFGNTVFPGITDVQELGVYLPWDKFEQARSNKDYILPTLVGVVVYISEFSDAPHVTGFIVDIARDLALRPATVHEGRRPGLIYPDEGEIPQHSLRLNRSPINGGGYAD